MRYRPQVDGEWIKPRMKRYYSRCCDCGLVHRYDFKVINKRVIYRAARVK